MGMLRRTLPLIAVVALLLWPQAAASLGLEFYVALASRILILTILATSLNLLVGLCGLVSLGHAAFFGAGAYAVAIAAVEWPGASGAWWAGDSAWLAWPLAMATSALLALVIGAVSVRTRGAYFIMITLAFAQMVYYVFVSLKKYGGDDGLSLPRRSRIPGLDLGNDTTFYYVVLLLAALMLLLFARLVHSRLGTVLRAIKDNEVRAESVGFACYRYKLAAFVMAGAGAGLAGALMANQNSFVSPNMMHWEQSGVALVMVILGGVGQPWGALVGATMFLLLEELLSAFTQRWQIGLGLVLLLVVFFAPRGVAGLFAGRR
jgi:branched-chain amino acid transport system permease protein